jgi:hypothetical protein
MNFGLYLGSSGGGGSNCMGSSSVVWDGMVISQGGGLGCGVDGGCSVMMVVDGVVLGSGSS